MDPFAVIMLGGVAGLLIALLLIGRLTPGSGAKELDWHPTRSVDAEVQNDIDDLEQMLAATNRRRRARGEADLTEADLHARVAEDTHLLLGREDDARDDEILQVLAAKNRRRVARGLPELTLAEFRASLGGEE
jgi:hypothetical protein